MVMSRTLCQKLPTSLNPSILMPLVLQIGDGVNSAKYKLKMVVVKCCFYLWQNGQGHEIILNKEEPMNQF